MAITYAQLKSYAIPEAVQTVTSRDCILYALSVGLGNEPTDPRELRYVYEQDLAVLPMMASVIAGPGFWMRREDTGIDWRRVLHGEQSITIHRPIPIDVPLTGRSRVVGINDKGRDKGAIVYIRREVCDPDGEPIFTIDQTNFCRGDGGCGGGDPAPFPPQPVPERDPDLVCDLAIPEGAALLYRLNGDYNPLHADPEVARAAGFPRPILHGLCTFGYAGHAVLRTACKLDGRRVERMAARFTAPVFPGETVRTEVWEVETGTLAFRARVTDRNAVVLDHGVVTLESAATDD